MLVYFKAIWYIIRPFGIFYDKNMSPGVREIGSGILTRIPFDTPLKSIKLSLLFLLIWAATQTYVKVRPQLAGPSPSVLS
jgi:hypothetical protein